MKTRDDKMTLEIFIHNLTRAQAIAIEDMLAVWQQSGSLGCSRWTGFYSDGDGNFRPTCVVNGHVARHQQYVPADKFWTGGEPWRGEYRIDFDPIAGQLREMANVAANSYPANTCEQPQSADAVGQRASHTDGERA